jgi:hypothetical protein
MPILLTREMFSISVDGARAEIKVWRRPDLDSASGTRNTVEMTEEAAKLPGRGIKEVIFDLREAPGVAGPKSTELLGGMFARWATAKLRVAVLINDDPLKVLQFNRLVSDHAQRNACIARDEDEASRWFASLG